MLVTGASGFIGSAVTHRLVGDRMAVRAATHRQTLAPVPGIQIVPNTDIGGEFDWGDALSGCDAVGHAAARVHLVKDSASDPLAEFRRVNVDGALALARKAAEAGVRRFVFLSTVKVNGEVTYPGRPFKADDVPAPEDAYGVSKYEAEVALRRLSATTGMEVVIIRPVLVYGPGVKANFLAMIRAVDRGWPLPLGAIDNRRSLVGVSNLVDLIATCLRHPAAANQTFLVSDDSDLSTTELLKRTAAALGRSARLFPVPPRVLQTGATILAKGKEARRLLGSLQVDISRTRQLLGWSPPMSVDQQLTETAEWFRARKGAAPR